MSIKNLIQKDQFYHFYQPIFDINHWTIIGYEGLLRTPIYQNPEYVFNLAKKEKQLYELDSRSIHKAANTYTSAGFSKKDGHLFLNVFPSTLINTNFSSFVDRIMNDDCLNCQQIILEINEIEKLNNFSEFKKTVFSLKDKGILFAIDDLGKGNSEFRSIVELEPNFIKLDRYFSKNLNTSKRKQTIIQMLLSYCEKFNSKLILEGIENAKEMAMAKSLGLSYAQGNILGKPDLLHKVC